MYRHLPLISFLLLSLSFTATLPAQTVREQYLILEKLGSAKTIRIPAGAEITYSLRDGQGWYTGEIQGFRFKDSLLVMADRYVKVSDITALRYNRAWVVSVGKQLMYFGAAWSGFALIGTLTDGNPDTNYRLSDAIVTAAAVTTGLVLPRVFRYRKVKMGNRNRLRLLDLRIDATP
ncbi:MAG: hypothetical protein H6555_02305 [Lewinellaceae bacterium]|nr:hypothetical protein [Lewinellaceae bacterium]